MSIKGPANSLPTDHTGGSCFLPGSSGDAPNDQSPGTRQAFEPEVVGRQQNSYYFMAPLPDSFSPELMRSSIGCQRRIQPSNLRSWDTLFPQVLLATRVNLHATPRLPLLPICEEESWGYGTPERISMVLRQTLGRCTLFTHSFSTSEQHHSYLAPSRTADRQL